MRVATTTFDFSGYVNHRTANAADILAMLADSGCKYVDFSLALSDVPGSPLLEDGWEKWVNDIGNISARLGLKLIQSHSSDTVYEYGEKRDYLTSIIKREIEVCGMLGIGGIVVHGIEKANGEREEVMEKNTEFYKELLPLAEKNGVEIYTENTCTANCPTYYLFDGKDMNELCERVNHPLFGACWDVGHGHVQGVDQYKEITTMGKNLKALHVHDNYGVADIHIQPYGGNVCYDALIKGLVDIDYKGYFTLEALCAPVSDRFCFCNRKPFEKDGVVYDKALMPPLALKIRSERLMLDTVRFMLEAYDCYED